MASLIPYMGSKTVYVNTLPAPLVAQYLIKISGMLHDCGKALNVGSYSMDVTSRRESVTTRQVNSDNILMKWHKYDQMALMLF